MLFYLMYLLPLLIPTISCAKIDTVQTGNVKVKLLPSSSLKGTKWNVNGRYVDAYLGIPFAKPPVGTLRFASPVESDMWSGELDATKLSNSCWQVLCGEFDLKNPAARIWTNNTEMSEDCLYMNIWTPSNSSMNNESLPVMVWIFGGGFFSGTSTLEVYDGKYLAAMENVIVVSMQYRLGPFGFLYIESKVRGNMGLLDQQLALKWIQKYIDKFNGDAKRVTLFGESAGAVSAGLHYLSPSSRPLFQRMILQSSGPLNRWALWTKPVAHEMGISFIKASNCSDRTHDLAKEVECLQRLPASTISDKIFELSAASARQRASRLTVMSPKPQWPVPFLSNAAQYFDAYMRPVMDGDFLPDCPSTVLSSITSAEAPEALLGNVEKEGVYWLLYGLQLKEISFLHANGTVTLPLIKDLQKLQIDYQQLVQAQFMSIGHLINPFPSLAAVQYGFNSPGIPEVTFYNTQVKYNFLTSNEEFINRLDDLSGELDFVCPTLLFARLLANINGSKVQYYNFRHKTLESQFPEWAGTMHGYEIEYIFGMPYSQPFTSKYYNFTDQEAALSRRIMRYWANFAKTGDATSDLTDIEVTTKWPYFDGMNQRYFDIDLTTAQVKESLRRKGCTFWNDVFPSLVQLYLRRSGYRSCPHCSQPNGCPYMEASLYPVDRFRDFVTGVYHDGSGRSTLSWISVFILQWTLVSF